MPKFHDEWCLLNFRFCQSSWERHMIAETLDLSWENVWKWSENLFLIQSWWQHCFKILSLTDRSCRRMTRSELLEDTKSFCTLASMFRNCLTLVPCTIVFDSLNDLKPSMGQDISFIKSKWVFLKVNYSYADWCTHVWSSSYILMARVQN